MYEIIIIFIFSIVFSLVRAKTFFLKNIFVEDRKSKLHSHEGVCE